MEKAKLSIARVSCSEKPDYMVISVFSEDFNKIILVKLSLVDFTLALTGRDYVPCEVEKYVS